MTTKSQSIKLGRELHRQVGLFIQIESEGLKNKVEVFTFDS